MLSVNELILPYPLSDHSQKNARSFPLLMLKSESLPFRIDRPSCWDCRHGDCPAFILHRFAMFHLISSHRPGMWVIVISSRQGQDKRVNSGSYDQHILYTSPGIGIFNKYRHIFFCCGPLNFFRFEKHEIVEMRTRKSILPLTRHFSYCTNHFSKLCGEVHVCGLLLTHTSSLPLLGGVRSLVTLTSFESTQLKRNQEPNLDYYHYGSSDFSIFFYKSYLPWAWAYRRVMRRELPLWGLFLFHSVTSGGQQHLHAASSKAYARSLQSRWNPRGSLETAWGVEPHRC